MTAAFSRPVARSACPSRSRWCSKCVGPCRASRASSSFRRPEIVRSRRRLSGLSIMALHRAVTLRNVQRGGLQPRKRGLLGRRPRHAGVIIAEPRLVRHSRLETHNSYARGVRLWLQPRWYRNCSIRSHSPGSSSPWIRRALAGRALPAKVLGRGRRTELAFVAHTGLRVSIPPTELALSGGFRALARRPQRRKPGRP